MPPYQQPADQWFARQLAELKNDLQAVKKQGTQYVVDPTGVCQAIAGDVTHDHQGNATGLAGWGIAVLHTGPWVAPELLNSWENEGTAGVETAGYLKDALGFVHFKGRIKSGASDTTAFVLPAGFRPGANSDYGVGARNSLTPITASLVVRANGEVVPFYASAITSLGLSGVTFLAEN